MEGERQSWAEFKVGKKNSNICAHCISVKVYSLPDNTNQRDTACLLSSTGCRVHRVIGSLHCQHAERLPGGEIRKLCSTPLNSNKLLGLSEHKHIKLMRFISTLVSNLLRPQAELSGSKLQSVRRVGDKLLLCPPDVSWFTQTGSGDPLAHIQPSQFKDTICSISAL